MKKVLIPILMMSSLIAVASPVLADQPMTINQRIFAFLAGSEVFHDGGGGVAVTHEDKITCAASEVATQEEDISSSYTCTNSKGRQADGGLAQAMVRLLAAEKSASGDSVAPELQGVITCTLSQTAAPGGTVSESVSCQ